MCLHSRPVTCQAGKGVFVPGAENPFVVTSKADGMTERHFSIHWVLLLPKYNGEISADEFHFNVRPGMLAILPPHTTITLRFHRKSTQYYAHLSLPSGREPGTLVPGIIRLRGKRAAVEALFAAGVEAFGAGRVAEANEQFERLLALVSTLEGQQNVATVKMPPKIRDTLKLIEDRLDRPIYVEELAAEVQISRRHLLNLFRRFVGATVAEYLQKRRLERALVLLKNSQLTIKAIAGEVGVGDLQLFNKLVRRGTGLSPRAYRQRILNGYGVEPHVPSAATRRRMKH